VNFEVQVDGEPKHVEVMFGDQRDIAQIRRWRSPLGSSENPHVRDALEFSRLAAKRWRYYFRTNAAARSLAELEDSIHHHGRKEIGFMVLARATWPMRQSVLGLCHCRRTWCNHLAVDFAAVHPQIVGSFRSRIRGIGTGMFYALTQIAEQIGITTIWGEATVNSAPFYERVLGLAEVKDLFVIAGPVLENVRREYEKLHAG
jgi:hypothetical protein